VFALTLVHPFFIAMHKSKVPTIPYLLFFPLKGSSSASKNRRRMTPLIFAEVQKKKYFAKDTLQNLVGIDLKNSQAGGMVLHVKDLPLYPIPIVRDSMSVYELLDLFQLGMSR